MTSMPWPASTSRSTLCHRHARAIETGRRVADPDLDPSGVRVPERVSKRFRRNLVDVVTDDRVQIARLTLTATLNAGGGRRVPRQSRAGRQRLDRMARSLRSGVDAAACYRVAALGDGFAACSSQRPASAAPLPGARQQIRRGLEPQQQHRGSSEAGVSCSSRAMRVRSLDAFRRAVVGLRVRPDELARLYATHKTRDAIAPPAL
jgi:hypothetical protein